MTKKFSLLMCLSVVVLSSCGDTEVKAQTVPQSEIFVKSSNEFDQNAEKLDLSQLSIPELQSEAIRVKKLRENLEKGIDEFSENDPRWDVLEGFLKQEIEIEKAKTAAEKAKTAESEEILRRARLLAGEK